MNKIKFILISLLFVLTASSISGQTVIKNRIIVDSVFFDGRGIPSDPLTLKLDSINELIADLGYKDYVAWIKNTGVGTFSNIVLQNDLGGTVVWTYDAVGEYTATLTNAFTLNKSVAFLTADFYNSSAFTANGGFNSDDEFHLNVRGTAATSTNLGWVFVQIRVYN